MGKYSISSLFASIYLTSLLCAGESASTSDKRTNAPLSDWKDKLSQVLDTETKELKLLHNLITESESEVDKGGVDSGDIETKLSNLNPPLYSIADIDTDNKKELRQSDPIEHLKEKGILIKLEENSRRMDSMVVFLADLRNVLSEAITAQSKQMRFQTEILELREEIEYLRKDVQHLKAEQASVVFTKNPSLENKIQNDETTIQWLKESTKELHNQLNDMSRSCNATSLIQMKQNLDQQSQRQQSDLIVVQKQIESIQLQQFRQDEQITEAKGNIDDVRSWQKSMGQKFMDAQLTFSEGDKVTSNDILEEEHFLTEALKASSNFSPTHGRHSKKLKAHLREISKTSKILGKDHYHLNKRLDKLEKSQKFVLDLSRNMKINGEKSPEQESRLSGMEQIMSQYTLSLQGLADKVNVVNELQESSTQLFTALEELETRYDERFTEMQTNLAKVEASVSSISNSNEDLKEQQGYQRGIVQNVKKDLLETKGKLQKNHLRLASIQSQMLKWSSQKCSNENSESIQNIRISSLESFLQLLKKESLAEADNNN